MLSFRIFVVFSSALVSQRRCKSTSGTSGISTTFITMKKNQSFKKAWLSDVSTYPLLFSLIGGVVMAGGVFISMVTNQLSRCEARQRQEACHAS
jgi:hypothetical protein